MIPKGNMPGGGLVKLLEECGELVDVCAKKLARGEHLCTFDGRSFRGMLENEIADVRAACLFVEMKFNLDSKRMALRTKDKFDRYMEWDR